MDTAVMLPSWGFGLAQKELREATPAVSRGFGADAPAAIPARERAPLAGTAASGKDRLWQTTSESASRQAEAPATRAAFLRSLREVENFAAVFGGVRLRGYQREAARAIVASVLGGKGLSIVVMFPRQSGKNLLQAQLEVFLMNVFSQRGAEMVKLSPTYQPQSLNAMRRLESALQANWLTRDRWQRSAGNHYRFGNAHLVFLSAAPGSNIVGATASTLLMLDEAQDIETNKYDKQIAPMAASTNATRVFWGTAWTGQTLLARELRLAQAAEARDGIRRVFQLGAEAVRAEAPAYGVFVDEQVARLGRGHPLVRSQYFGEEIGAEGGLFPAARLGLMRGSHRALAAPEAGKTYAMLVDLAGEDENARLENWAAMEENERLANPDRDATAITIVEVDGRLLGDSLVGKPCYKVVQRQLWLGERHSAQYSRLLALVETWQPRKLVVDASGVGAGVASFLAEKLGDRVIPLTFNRLLKSRLGWGFLTVVDTGRFQDCQTAPAEGQTGGKPASADGQALERQQADLQALFERQLEGIRYEVSPGPERLIRWGTPDGARDPHSGGRLHDDLVVSAAMTAILDEQNWHGTGEGFFIPAADPLKEMEKGF